MKKFTVDPARYRYFDYPAYINRKGETIDKPKRPLFEVGDVVYIIPERALGVVLGHVDHDLGELRTDMSGMVCFSDLQHAERKHFNTQWFRFVDRLLDDVEGQLRIHKMVV